MLGTTPRFTRDDYMRLPEGFRAELLRGALVKEPAPVLRHRVLMSRLHSMLVALRGPDQVIPSPIDFFVDDLNVLQPDVAVLHGPAPPDPGAVMPVPALVVEILSPGTARRDRGPKTEVYLRAGVGEVWLVDPRRRTVEIVTAAGRRTFGRDDRPASEVVSGFAPDLAALFA